MQLQYRTCFSFYLFSIERGRWIVIKIKIKSNFKNNKKIITFKVMIFFIFLNGRRRETRTHNPSLPKRVR